MDFELTPDQAAIVKSIGSVCERFGDDYWRQRDMDGEFPEDFRRAIADGGWLGITMPVAHGGAGLGVTEAALVMRTVASNGGAMSAASTIHINMFGPQPIVVHGTDDQKVRFLPPLIAGDESCCFGVTEPDAGLDTGRIKTRADRVDGGYVITGQKIWTSTAQRADRIMLLARTEPRDTAKRSTDGLTLFYAPFDRSKIEVREIQKMGRKAVDSNQIFIDGLFVPEADRIGEEGKGFSYLLDGLNPERILIAAEAIGIGLDAISRASRYGRERIVFDRPIGQNQAVQHPLAKSWIELKAAELMMLKAARRYDNGEPCGLEANAAKYLAAEAAHTACVASIKAHGGMGYAGEFHVERLLREAFIPLLAPVSSEMILNYVAESALGLPKSY